MEKTDQYLEPLKYYESFLKNQHQENVEQYFDELTQKSGIDTGSNKATCNKYYAEKKILTKFQKSLSATKAGIVIMIILMILGVILGIIFLYNGISSAILGFTIAGIVSLVVEWTITMYEEGYHFMGGMLLSRFSFLCFAWLPT